MHIFVICLFFFFSSRRRHTRFDCDWSSDVSLPIFSWLTLLARRHADTSIAEVRAELTLVANQIDRQQPGRSTTLLIAPATRSEERRVGKECRTRWAGDR